jgi:coenzyme PQQ precursor peptide PqqA
MTMIGFEKAGCCPYRAAASRLVTSREMNMAWTTPVVVELCLGMEVTSYESASL